MPAAPMLLVTCEHGGHAVPARYRPLFAGRQALLRSHRGWDPGALQLARGLARHFAAPRVFSRTTRLLVDLNRSPGNRRRFSEVTRGLPAATRERIVRDHYLPYRHEVERQVGDAVATGRRVVHVSAHSFTPVLDGVRREADVGLLYDPRRRAERRIAIRWQEALRRRRPDLRVRRNYPYAGRADGLTTALRNRHPASRYLGIEVEVNQRLVTAGGAAWIRLRRDLARTLDQALH